MKFQALAMLAAATLLAAFAEGQQETPAELEKSVPVVREANARYQYLLNSHYEENTRPIYGPPEQRENALRGQQGSPLPSVPVPEQDEFSPKEAIIQQQPPILPSPSPTTQVLTDVSSSVSQNSNGAASSAQQQSVTNVVSVNDAAASDDGGNSPPTIIVADQPSSDASSLKSSISGSIQQSPSLQTSSNSIPTGPGTSSQTLLQTSPPSMQPLQHPLGSPIPPPDYADGRWTTLPEYPEYQYRENANYQVNGNAQRRTRLNLSYNPQLQSLPRDSVHSQFQEYGNGEANSDYNTYAYKRTYF